MDTLLSQLKGQGSPFTSPQPTSNTDKLLDTIHLLSQATLLVAQQLQERKQPTTTYLPTPLPTPKSSTLSSVNKTPPLTPSLAPTLSWVPRAPEHYSLTQPNPITATHTSVPIPTTKPTPPTPHTKRDRKPKSKWTKPSTQPIPSPTSITTTSAPPSRPAQPDQRPAQTDQREPSNQSHPLPTPTRSLLSPEAKAEAKAKRQGTT